ncbi:hypothetical protein ACFXG4_39345 [Nocardia sp. NPDC059246]|uniref:ISAzo13-like element transposase-related protein n=1 Tax=unclassified Nocardia TaxID=2637762 RepID=UPI0036953451
MNWRGRPLTSHEVVIETIASTRTSTGLRVEAALDDGDYPIGVSVSRERFAALPLQPHAIHGTWNYPLHPEAVGDNASPEQKSGPTHRLDTLRKLDDPRLTGLSSTELAQLRAELAPLQAARTQQRHCEQRGGRARRATGALWVTPLFDDADRVLLTLVYQRQVCSMKVLADLLEVTDMCIGDLVKRPAKHSRTTATTPAPPRSGSTPPATCWPSSTTTSSPPAPRSSRHCRHRH